MTVAGSLAMLLGFIFLHQQTGSFDILFIRDRIQDGHLSQFIVILIMAGLLSKSAVLPLQTWLPDAGVAPTPVTALLHAAVLVKNRGLCLCTALILTIKLDNIWHFIVPFIAATSTLIAGGAAFIERDIKRIIAYSTISQTGYIFLGLSTVTDIGTAGGLLYIMMHGLGKAGIFLSAGIVEQKTHTRDITKMGGLIRTMPVTAVSFLLCALSVMCIPPFGCFFSKYLVFTGAIRDGQYLLVTLFLIGAVFTILYLFRIFNNVFLGEPSIKDTREGSPVMVICVMIFALSSLLSGIFIKYPAALVQVITSHRVGIPL